MSLEYKAIITMAEVHHAFISSSASTILNITLTFSNVLREGAHYRTACYSALWDMKLASQTLVFGLLFGTNLLFQN